MKNFKLEIAVSQEHKDYQARGTVRTNLTQIFLTPLHIFFLFFHKTMFVDHQQDACEMVDISEFYSMMQFIAGSSEFLNRQVRKRASDES